MNQKINKKKLKIIVQSPQPDDPKQSIKMQIKVKANIKETTSFIIKFKGMGRQLVAVLLHRLAE